MTQAKSHKIFSIYLIGFLFAFYVALPTYINSSFLETFMSADFVGIIYTLMSILMIGGFFVAPLILRRFGNYRVAVILVLVEILVSLGLALAQTPFWSLIFFGLRLLAIPFIYFLLDIFLEGFSKNISTGNIRGWFLTLGNLAWIFAPLVSGLILTNGDYWRVYLASTLLLIPVLILLKMNLAHFHNSPDRVIHMGQAVRRLVGNKDLRNIYFSIFLLYFFYSWMTIYTPLYLHKVVGFSWGEIGTILSIMLLPFIFVQVPLGRLADKKWGEKEILSIGFVVISFFTALLFFIPASYGLWWWAGILFMTRVGAGAVEVMCDTYFFKKVGAVNADLISIFRMSNPVAYVLGPLVATLVLSLLPVNMNFLFLILSVIMLGGLFFSLALKDTR